MFELSQRRNLWRETAQVVEGNRERAESPELRYLGRELHKGVVPQPQLCERLAQNTNACDGSETAVAQTQLSHSFCRYQVFILFYQNVQTLIDIKFFDSLLKSLLQMYRMSTSLIPFASDLLDNFT